MNKNVIYWILIVIFLILGILVFLYEFNFDNTLFNLFSLDSGSIFQNKNEYNPALFGFFCFLPSIFLFIAWFFFRENSFKANLNQTNIPPKNRKPWEVVAYFQPPFYSTDSNSSGYFQAPPFNFFSTLFLELSLKNAIDIQVKNKKILGLFNRKEVFILLKNSSGLDEVENSFYQVLKLKKQQANSVDSEGYFSLNKSFNFFPRYYINLEDSFLSKINSFSKNIRSRFIINSFDIYQSLALFLILFFLFSFMVYPFVLLFLFYCLFYFLLFNFLYKGLFVSFKENYYSEYLGWKKFKNFFLALDSNKKIKISSEYLAYALAFNISKKVIKKWKDFGYINSKDYELYLFSCDAGKNYLNQVVHNNYSSG